MKNVGAVDKSARSEINRSAGKRGGAARAAQMAQARARQMTLREQLRSAAENLELVMRRMTVRGDGL
ncbi:MAG: hypothetical protein ACRCZI_11095 [Cetobacterium sp.]